MTRYRTSVLLTLTAALTALAVSAVSAVLAAPPGRHGATPARGPSRLPARTRAAAPDAAGFALVVAGTTTAYARANGESTRIANVSCVEASTGHYMCSYAVVRPHRAGECHLMQAVWTPDRSSTYTVTLAGRVDRCGTLRDAIRSLR